MCKYCDDSGKKCRCSRLCCVLFLMFVALIAFLGLYVTCKRYFSKPCQEDCQRVEVATSADSTLVQTGITPLDDMAIDGPAN